MGDRLATGTPVLIRCCRWCVVSGSGSLPIEGRKVLASGKVCAWGAGRCCRDCPDRGNADASCASLPKVSWVRRAWRGQWLSPRRRTNPRWHGGAAPGSGMAVANDFRDQGGRRCCWPTRITRFAEAHREVAVAAGEEGSLRGFPPSTSHTIMALAERAGPGRDGAGDITAVFSVLVAGFDMWKSPLHSARCAGWPEVVMDRRIAERGRFPAIDLLRSVSRSSPHAASDDETG